MTRRESENAWRRDGGRGRRRESGARRSETGLPAHCRHSEKSKRDRQLGDPLRSGCSARRTSRFRRRARAWRAIAGASLKASGLRSADRPTLLRVGPPGAVSSRRSTWQTGMIVENRFRTVTYVVPCVIHPLPGRGVGLPPRSSPVVQDMDACACRVRNWWGW